MTKNVLIVILLLALASAATVFLPRLLVDEGMVGITTTPGNAQIFINGERKGNSPPMRGMHYSIKLPVGDYRIEALIPSEGGEEDYALKADLLVAKDSMQTVSLELHKRPTFAFREKLKAKYSTGIPEPKMVAIPGGSFMMGCDSGKDCYEDEKPAHPVTLSPFQMSTTEITFNQYDACVAFGGCDYYPDDRGWGRGDQPVIGVSWDDTQQYVQWLSQETGKQYQLPTEAQWEYAARAGSSAKYSWGDEIGNNLANCDGCGSQWDNKQTAPVGSFAANAFGLFDMHGNAWEWCQDWYDGNHYQSSPEADPTGPTSGEFKVFRGGGWRDQPSSQRSAARSFDSLGNRVGVGFRLSLPN